MNEWNVVRTHIFWFFVVGGVENLEEEHELIKNLSRD
jgi:hypothetical protein